MFYVNWVVSVCFEAAQQISSNWFLMREGVKGSGSPRGTDFESPRALYNLIGIGQLTSAGRNLDAITSSPIGRQASSTDYLVQ